jgi:multisubunit Na+/H+ antiporter MnhF subunit
MDNRTVTINTGGISLIIFLVLLILKLSETVAISWFWVFFPLWIGYAIMLGIFLIVVLLGVIATIINSF